MKYRHYAPHATVTVLTGKGAVTAKYIRRHCTSRSGVICFEEYAPLFEGMEVHLLGPETDQGGARPRRVFDALREFDHTKVTEIYAQCPDRVGAGAGNRKPAEKGGGVPHH